jgi:hypothetical protein
MRQSMTTREDTTMDDHEAAATLQRILGKGWKVEPIQTYRTELTPAGEQLVMFPPAEPKPNASGKVQLNLFG